MRQSLPSLFWALLLPVPLVLGALVWRSPPAVPTPTEAAARSLQARSADVVLMVTAADAPAFRAVGRVTMARAETHLRTDGVEVVLDEAGTRVRVAGAADWIAVSPSGGLAFDDIVALLETIAAGAASDLEVDVDADGRIARIAAITADGHVVVRLGPYRT